MTEGQLRVLHKAIVAAVVNVRGSVWKSENDIICLFPPDMMSYGLGEEIVIEVTGIFEKTHEAHETDAIRQRLAEALLGTIYDMFPKTRIECFVYPFGPWGYFSSHS